MHRKLANSYIVTGRHQKADEVFQNMTKIKAFTADPKTWLEYASFLFTKLADPARARALLPRATQSVPQHAHRQLTEDFARLEFSSPNGDAERG
ncbi:rRNA biogenesis protein rrp5, partial [Cryomyces antarcticus]